MAKLVGGSKAGYMIAKVLRAYKRIDLANEGLGVHTRTELWEDVLNLMSVIDRIILKEKWEDPTRWPVAMMNVEQLMKNNQIGRVNADARSSVPSDEASLYFNVQVGSVSSTNSAIELVVTYYNFAGGGTGKDKNWNGNAMTRWCMFCGAGPIRRLAELVEDNGLSLLNCPGVRNKVYKYMKEEYKDMEGQRKKFPAYMLEARIKAQKR